MKALSIACGLLVMSWVLPVTLFAQNSGSATQAESGPSRTGRTGRAVGAPQVLEIPIPQADPQADSYQDPYQDSQDPHDPYQDSASQQGYEQGYEPYENTPQQAALTAEQAGTSSLPDGGQRTYLGVLYATAEQGPAGVKVLSIVPDSPAHRAGFIGANDPQEGGSDLLKAAIVVLAMSPAGPFAIPLAIAHDMYMNRDAPGDLIVSINNQPTPDAQEFTQVMRQHRPEDTVSFSIVRAGKPMQISVTLEEEPL